MRAGGEARGAEAARRREAVQIPGARLARGPWGVAAG